MICKRHLLLVADAYPDMTLSGNHTKGIGMVILNNVQPTPSRERYSSKLDIALGLASVSNSLAPLGLLDTLLANISSIATSFT